MPTGCAKYLRKRHRDRQDSRQATHMGGTQSGAPFRHERHLRVRPSPCCRLRCDHLGDPHRLNTANPFPECDQHQTPLEGVFCYPPTKDAKAPQKSRSKQQRVASPATLKRFSYATVKNFALREGRRGCRCWSGGAGEVLLRVEG